MKKVKPTIKLNSPTDTPDEEKIYVLEYPATERIKVRKVDIEKEIEQLNDDITRKEDRRDELLAIQADINKIK